MGFLPGWPKWDKYHNNNDSIFYFEQIWKTSKLFAVFIIHHGYLYDRIYLWTCFVYSCIAVSFSFSLNHSHFKLNVFSVLGYIQLYTQALLFEENHAVWPNTILIFFNKTLIVISLSISTHCLFFCLLQ